MSAFERAIGLILSAGILLGFPFFVFADSIGQQVVFSVDEDFDAQERSELPASLRKISDQLYYYIEDGWWNSSSVQRRNDVLEALDNLTVHFENEIYPALTALFGKERRPGIDQDDHITVLIHAMDENARGYFNTADGRTKFEAPGSNEREMVYLNLKDIETELAKSYLAHEFMHLIYFNQKEILRGVSDDVWIQEGYAELAPTLAGYDEEFEDSYLAKRVRDFTANPRDPLAEWRGFPSDYGVVSVFFQYVLDHYGVDVLVDSLQSSQPGMSAVSDALKQNGFEKDFSDVFTDWTIAVFLNNCAYGADYCFSDENLQKVRIAPFTNFLSPFGESELTVTNPTKNWAGNWHKISGGKGVLEVKFDGNPGARFVVPYASQKQSGEYEVAFFDLGAEQKGQIRVRDFGTEVASVIILPSIQIAGTGFGSSDPSYLFSWTVSTVTGDAGSESRPPTLPTTDGSEQGAPGADSQLMARLLEQISILQAEVARLQARLAALAGAQPQGSACQTFDTDLYVGVGDGEQVMCLQQFLKGLGPAIYPEGLVTGNFLSLTRAAVIRFQEMYEAEILAPLGLQKGTGFVGTLTRKKMNELLSIP